MAHAVSEIIERLGGPEQLARLTQVSTEAVRKWRAGGAIPARHWPAVIAATGLTLADMPGVPPPAPEADQPPPGASAVLALADGSLFWGRGFGATTQADGGLPAELCFNTAMTGYQEVLTDPSYAGQIITFTFPHIGNVGANEEDVEAAAPAARGLVVKEDVTLPSNWRARQGLGAWLRRFGLPGIAGVDTRALTQAIRDGGPPSAAIAHPADGRFDLSGLRARARAWPGLAGMDLAREVSCTQAYEWDETVWAWPAGYGRRGAPRRHVVAVDYGAKRNILRALASQGCRVSVVPATTTAEEILGRRPDGVFLSNGPGDPAATGAYALAPIRAVLAAGVPLFGICLGHQLLALALGAHTFKLARGHRGANQPVQEVATGRVEITSQNHGFAVDPASLPAGVVQSHVSLFDGTNEGIVVSGAPVFSVQYHPEASPGPSDAQHLFRRFFAMMGG